MSPLRVYVVDPDEQRGAWLARLAAAHGHEVERLANGERAIDRFVQAPADALLVQYVLPGRDGVATAEAIRWAPGGRDVRVVLLADEEPVNAPLQMLALRVDAMAALVGPLEEDAVERALADLERDWNDEGTLAIEDARYADQMLEARRQSVPAPPPARAPHQDWLDAATVIAGAVRVETVEALFGDEPTTRGGDAEVARAIGMAQSPPTGVRAVPPERPMATFDDVTRTEPGEDVSVASTTPQRPLDASDARALLAGAPLPPRPQLGSSRPPPSPSRFAARPPSSSFRAPSAVRSGGASSVSAPISSSVTPVSSQLTPQPTSLPRSPATTHTVAAPSLARPDAAAAPPAATPTSRAEISTRQITAPRDDADGAPTANAIRQLVADPQSVDEGRFVSARARETRAADWSGSFSSTPFPALLRHIAEERGSGGLVCAMPIPRPGDPRPTRATVDGEVATKVVFFRGGVPVHVRSNLVDECLGQLLLRKKRITVATLEESIRRLRERGGLQGQILVSMGVLSPIELGELLSEQARQKLFDLFGWRRGEYRFAAAMEAPRDGVALEMALPDMVYEGVCAAMPATLLLDIMTPRLALFVVPDPVRLARFARVRVAKDLREVLESLDGATRLRDVLGRGPRPGAIAQLLYALECLRAVTYEPHAIARHVSLPPLSLEQPIDPPLEPLGPAGPSDDGEWDDVTHERPPRAHRAAEQSVVAHAPIVVGARQAAPVAAPHAPVGPPIAPEPPRPVLSARPTASELDALPSVSASSVGARSSEDDLGVNVTGPRAPIAGGALDAHVDRMFEAERCFRRGNRSLARGEHRAALTAFERAVELCPDEGEFVAYLGWARYCVDPTAPGNAEAAVRELVRATTLAPDLHLTHLLHARVLDHAGRTQAARAAYEEVLALEPSMPEALEALARLRGARR